MCIPGSKTRRLALATLLGVAPLAGCFDMVIALGGGMTDELRTTGITAPADILEIWDTGWTINDDPVIGMKVRVRPVDRAPFETTIEKTTISRIGVPQFQPGHTIPVRFDPNDTSIVAVDFEAPATTTVTAPSSGNPYRDRFVATQSLGVGFSTPPAEPRLYLGTGDSAADMRALYENGYALLGGSAVQGGADPDQALEQGKDVGAAVVVVYGSFTSSSGTLDVLPYRPRPTRPDQPVATPPTHAGVVFALGAGQQIAAYWGKAKPVILGVVSRPLEPDEQARLGRKDGVFVDAVASGSPAAEAGVQAGDLIVAIGGTALVDPLTMPHVVDSLAGQTVTIDLIRDGSPLSVTAKLNAVERLAATTP